MYSNSDDKEHHDRQTKTVSEYFNNIKFFENDEDRIHFVNRSTRSLGEKKMMLMKTPHEFFEKAWSEVKYNEVALKYFFKENIYGCKADAVLLDFDKWKMDNSIELNSDEDSFPRQLEYQQSSHDRQKRVLSSAVISTDPSTDDVTVLKKYNDENMTKALKEGSKEESLEATLKDLVE